MNTIVGMFFVLLLVSGCATKPVSYTTGDCMEVTQIIKFGEQSGTLDSGEAVYDVSVIHHASDKVRCPGDRPEREFHGRDFK